jgi:hypothetical protein
MSVILSNKKLFFLFCTVMSVNSILSAEDFDAVELVNKLMFQIEAPKKKTTKNELLHFLSILTPDIFLEIMAAQTRGFKSLEILTKDLSNTAQAKYIAIIKNKYRLTLAERDQNSQLFLEIFYSQEGQASIKKMLSIASKEQLEQMFKAIDEQKKEYDLIKMPMPKNIKLLYEAWEQEIKKAIEAIA